MAPRGFLAGHPSEMVLGDNIFFGHGLREILTAANARVEGRHRLRLLRRRPGALRCHSLRDGGGRGRAGAGVVEKPKRPPSNYAVTGLYFLDGTAPERARAVRPSARGELEMVTLLEMYLAEDRLKSRRWAAASPGSTSARMPRCSTPAI